MVEDPVMKTRSGKRVFSPNKLEALMNETREFPPGIKVEKGTPHIKSMEEYKKMYDESINNPNTFWSRMANDLHWFHPFHTVLDQESAPFFKWFLGGKTNICYNSLDRHLKENSDKVAIYWEGEPGDSLTLTYKQLHLQVCKFANCLKYLGVERGDKICIYMPMTPEMAISCLAAARIGAIHSVVFGGFSSQALRTRLMDFEPSVIVTANMVYRRGLPTQLKQKVDQAIEGLEYIKRIVVVNRDPKTELPCAMKEGRDVWYGDIMKMAGDDCPCEEMDAEDILFLLYTSGTTATPKGIIHTTGGYMVYTYLTAKYVFDLHQDDIYYCTADLGWITGHSYVLYGPLLNGASVVIYEGALNYPDKARWWNICAKYSVSIFYTAPTAIRMFMAWGDKWVTSSDLSKLRILGCVGEPINPEAWIWYYTVVGNKKCSIVDTWWQTETGGIMITPLPGCTPMKPGSTTYPFFGVDPVVLDGDGNPAEAGFLAIRKPWPGMLRGIYKNNSLYCKTYWSKWGGIYYFSGDAAHCDESGCYWIKGRVDDVVNTSGHRLGTAELESALITHPLVSESGVIGVPHPIKGEGLIAFVILIVGAVIKPELEGELMNAIRSEIGSFAIPQMFVFCDELPKTRSGKIMRRILKAIAQGHPLGDVSTITNADALPQIMDSFQTAASKK